MTQMNQKVFFERTLKDSVHLSGKALFTGEEVEIILRPASVGEGISFNKITKDQNINFRALGTSIFRASARNTILSDGSKEGIVHCVEHLMSALFGCGLTNVVIEVKGSEIPIFDGSSKCFVEAIEAVGIVDQDSLIEPIKIVEPHYWSSGNVHFIALPADELRFSYTLSYENHPILSSQFYTLPFTENVYDVYRNEVAPCRTFCLYDEAMSMMESGLIKGGTLDCAIVVKEDEIVNPEGLRFKDEMVRHKVLDMIGDIALIGKPVLAHFIGIRSGHEANAALVKKITSSIEALSEEAEEGAYI